MRYIIVYSFIHANGEQSLEMTAEKRGKKAVNSFIAVLQEWCKKHGKTNLMTMGGNCRRR